MTSIILFSLNLQFVFANTFINVTLLLFVFEHTEPFYMKFTFYEILKVLY